MVWVVSNSSDSTAGDELHFTPDRATEMLPLVRSIVADITRLSESIDRQREQIRGIDNLPETIEHADYQDEIRDIRASVDSDQRRLQICVDELTALGVEAHEPIDGFVDFPAVMNRRRVLLCWHFDDERVSHWHEPGQSPGLRERIESQTFGLESFQ